MSMRHERHVAHMNRRNAYKTKLTISERRRVPGRHAWMKI